MNTVLQLTPLKQKPILFIMMNDTDEADDVASWLREKYPAEFGGEKTQVIHTDKSGEVSKKDWTKHEMPCARSILLTAPSTPLSLF